MHPRDRNFSFGGTQDNGTNFYRPDGSWIRVDFGDGGYAVETVVPKSIINTLIPALKDAGATGILELPITKIVP